MFSTFKKFLLVCVYAVADILSTCSRIIFRVFICLVKYAFWAAFSIRFCTASLFIEVFYWFESLVIRPETELILQFLMVQYFTKFQSMCFIMKI